MDTLIFFCTLNGVLPIFVRSWHTNIRVYSIITTILGLTLILFGILTIIDHKTDEDISNFMDKMWNDRLSSLEAQRFWDDVQNEYECCGFNSSFSYDSGYPESCCVNHVKPCTIDHIHRLYCSNAVKHYHRHFLVIVLATVAFTLAFVCLILISLAQFSKRICGLPIEGDESASVL